MPSDDIHVDAVDDEAFVRVVGRRARAPLGEVPSAEARSALTSMAQYQTRAPKGVFRYRSHEEANRDRDAWTLAAMLAALESASSDASSEGPPR